VQEWCQCDYIAARLLAMSLKGSQHHDDKTTGLPRCLERAVSGGVQQGRGYSHHWQWAVAVEAGLHFSKKKRRSMTGNGVKWCAKRGDPGGKQWVAIERAVRGEEG